MKKFGSDDARQVSVQTGEDNVEIDTQTDPISHSNVWVQCPPEDLRGFGREEGVEGEEGGAGGCGPFEDVVVGGVRGGVQAGQSSVRLVSFLKNAGQVSLAMCVLSVIFSPFLYQILILEYFLIIAHNDYKISQERHTGTFIQLISAVFEHSVLCIWEIYALENEVFYIALYGPYKP